MRKEPFPIKNILDSLREDVQNGTITLSDLMEQHGLDYNYSGTPEAAKEADQ